MTPPAGRGWIAAVLIVVLSGRSAAAAQSDTGELRLTVTDLTGGTLEATGTLASEAPQLLRTFRTDERGRFTLERVPFGVYRLTVEREGFATATTIVDVHSAVPKDIPVQLAISQLATEVEVSVAAARPLIDPDRTGVSFAIGAPQLQAHVSTVPGRRVLDLVDQQPGWLMEANGVLHPRGSEYQTLFVVDGVPMDENRSPAFAPDLQENDIHAMAVLTGNFPAEYGRKLGGVVEVTTSQDVRDGFHGRVDAGFGRFGTRTGAFSGSRGWSSRAVTISGSAARTDRYLDPPVLQNFTNRGSLGGVLASYQDRPSERDRLRFTWHHRRSDFLVPNEIVQEAAGQRQQNAGRETAGQGAWTRILGARAVFTARGLVQHLSASLESNAAATPIIVDAERSFTRSYVNAAIAADLGQHQLKVGGDLVASPVREELAYEITDEDLIEEGTRESFHFADRRRSREQSLFVQDTIRRGPLTISAGLRWDRYGLVVEDHAFSPRLGVAWVPASDLVVRAAYDRVFQTPAVENLLLASSPLVDDVNPTSARLPVEPSRGHFFEGGVTSGLRGLARLDVTAYRRTFINFADDDVFLNTGVTFPVAFASAAIAGLDARVSLPSWRRLGGFVSYALLKGTAELPVVGGLFIGDEALEELEERGSVAITQDQRHTFRAQARCELNNRAWVAATVRYGSGLPVEIEDDGDRDELAEQYGGDILERVDLDAGRVRANVTLDLGLGAELWRRDARRLTLRAEFTNLTNRLNVINFAGVFSGTALSAPRSAVVRVQVEF